MNGQPKAFAEYDSCAPTLGASLLVRDHPDAIVEKLRRALRAFALRLLEIADEVDGRQPLKADQDPSQSLRALRGV